MKKPIQITHRVEYCTKVDAPYVRARVFLEGLDISVPYLSDGHGWLAHGAEFVRKGADLRSPLSYIRDAIVWALKGKLSEAKMDWVYSGYSGHRGCGCGRNHLILYRNWEFKSTKRSTEIASSFVGEAWGNEEYAEDRQATMKFWWELEKEKARYEALETASEKR